MTRLIYLIKGLNIPTNFTKDRYGDLVCTHTKEEMLSFIKKIIKFAKTK